MCFCCEYGALSLELQVSKTNRKNDPAQDFPCEWHHWIELIEIYRLTVRNFFVYNIFGRSGDVSAAKTAF